MEKIIDLDASKIITAGTIEKPGYVSRITEEIRDEVKRHGNYLNTGAYIVEPSPGWEDFTCLSDDAYCSVYEFEASSGAFSIFRMSPEKNSYITLCGNHDHKASVVMFSPDGKKYGICSGLVNKDGDFSLVKNYIFYPEDHTEFGTDDECLGKTLKRIMAMREQQK